MTFLESVKMIKTDPWNLYYFWQGTIRQWLWDNYPILIRQHIQEQYYFRKASSICSNLDSCVVCGCSIPGGLLFADKPCALSKIQPVNFSLFGNIKEICYPKMMSKKSWEIYKQNYIL